jgi:hypothetical protein
MQVEESFLADKFRQLKAENERLKAEIDGYRTRLGNATEDYVSTVGALGTVASYRHSKRDVFHNRQAGHLQQLLTPTLSNLYPCIIG